MKYSVLGPDITAADLQAITVAAKNDWYANANQTIKKFETEFAKIVDRKYAIALPSCTSAIHLSLAALKLTPSDEVIVPDITWIATSAPIQYVGAKTVFVDIEEDSWCICPQALQQAITDNTKAIIVVNLYGNMANWNKILDIARKNKVFVIEDAAESIGGKYLDKPSGSLGDVSVFSFHGSKTVTTAEGGMLVTDNLQLYEYARILQDHGRKPADTDFFNQTIGFKYKMTAMQAALGISQISRLDSLVNKKRHIFNWYQEYLANIDDIQLNIEQKGNINAFWAVTLVLGTSYRISRDNLRAQLKNSAIDTRPFFHPLSSLPAYEQVLASGQALKYPSPIAYKISPLGINLPSALNLQENDVAYICQQIEKVIAQ